MSEDVKVTQADILAALKQAEQAMLDDVADMMSAHVDNWPHPKRIEDALALISKALTAAVKEGESLALARMLSDDAIESAFAATIGKQAGSFELMRSAINAAWSFKAITAWNTRTAANADVDRLVDALEFYAEADRYDYDETCCWSVSTKKRLRELQKTGGDILCDTGEKARAALAAFKGQIK